MVGGLEKKRVQEKWIKEEGRIEKRFGLRRAKKKMKKRICDG